MIAPVITCIKSQWMGVRIVSEVAYRLTASLTIAIPKIDLKEETNIVTKNISILYIPYDWCTGDL